MSQVSKNYFTTGEFAKICGINKKMDIDTTHTINLAFLV